jgi:hypothetical protein
MAAAASTCVRGKWASLLSSLFLLATVLLSTSGPFFGKIDQSTIRDIGLLGGTLSLMLSTTPTSRSTAEDRARR